MVKEKKIIANCFNEIREKRNYFITELNKGAYYEDLKLEAIISEIGAVFKLIKTLNGVHIDLDIDLNVDNYQFKDEDIVKPSKEIKLFIAERAVNLALFLSESPTQLRNEDDYKNNPYESYVLLSKEDINDLELYNSYANLLKGYFDDFLHQLHEQNEYFWKIDGVHQVLEDDLKLSEDLKIKQSTSNDKVIISWNAPNNVLTDIFRQFKTMNYYDGRPLIENSYEDIALFLQSNFNVYQNTKLTTILGVLKKNITPHKNKRIVIEKNK